LPSAKAPINDKTKPLWRSSRKYTNLPVEQVVGTAPISTQTASSTLGMSATRTAGCRNKGSSTKEFNADAIIATDYVKPIRWI